MQVRILSTDTNLSSKVYDMGCWNKTCGLSGLHIYVGTPVYVFVLEPTRKEESRCYSTGLFKPLLIPFESYYNDYGAGENSHGVALNLIMDKIRDRLIEVPESETRYKPAVTKSTFDVDIFFNAVHNMRLSIVSRYNDQTDVNFVMFRKDVVDQILARREIQKYVGQGLGNTGHSNAYIVYKFADIVASVNTLLSHLRAYVKTTYQDPLIVKYKARDWLESQHNVFKAAAWLSEDDYRFSKLLNFANDILPEILDAPDSKMPYYEALTIEYLKGKFLDGYMDSIRKLWTPGGFEGSQNNDSDAYRLMCSIITEVLDQEDADQEDADQEDADQ